MTNPVEYRFRFASWNEYRANAEAAAHCAQQGAFGRDMSRVWEGGTGDSHVRSGSRSYWGASDIAGVLALVDAAPAPDAATMRAIDDALAPLKLRVATAKRERVMADCGGDVDFGRLAVQPERAWIDRRYVGTRSGVGDAVRVILVRVGGHADIACGALAFGAAAVAQLARLLASKGYVPQIHAYCASTWEPAGERASAIITYPVDVAGSCSPAVLRGRLGPQSFRLGLVYSALQLYLPPRAAIAATPASELARLAAGPPSGVWSSFMDDNCGAASILGVLPPELRDAPCVWVPRHLHNAAALRRWVGALSAEL